MRDLLFVAHAVAFAALATGLRAWLHRNQPAMTAVSRPRDTERYQMVIRELADLERRKNSNEISPADYDARRGDLVREAMRLRSR